ncbi:MAG: hexosyltransferase [Chloroflexi bacterium]|nr:MAG: hexosyltransferase [Chloroflexota bacterium]
MKIGLIVPGFSASEADWCIPALLNLVRALSRVHQVHVFTLRYPHQRGRYSVHGASVHAFAGGLASGFGRLPLLTRALAGVVAEARRGAFDVLHGVWADEPGFVAVTAARLLGIPAIMSVAGGELVGFTDIGYGGQLSRLNRWLIRRALHAAQQVTVGSHLLGEQVAAYGAGGALGARLAVVPLGVDVRQFTPDAGRWETARQPASKSRPARLLHVASLAPVKDQATLLRAFAQVVAASEGTSTLRLDLVGDGPLRQPLQALAKTMGIGAHVHFHGAIPHQQLPDLYRAADLCLLTSRYESQNLAVLEAAACGAPVVGTTVGVVPELAPPDCTAAVGDAGALAEAIQRLLADDKRRIHLGQMQCELVRRRFALECTVEKLEGLYDTVTR